MLIKVAGYNRYTSLVLAQLLDDGLYGLMMHDQLVYNSFLRSAYLMSSFKSENYFVSMMIPIKLYSILTLHYKIITVLPQKLLN